jgi:hypothetical protein
VAQGKKAKKAKGKRSTRKAPKAKRQERRPLDDPRWLPLIEAHKLLSPQSGFAIFDLLEALKSDKLGCMRRSTTNPGDRESVPALFWEGLEIDETMINVGRTDLYRGPPIQVEARGQFRDPETRLEGWAYYVWKPDLDRLLLGPQAEPGAEMPPRAKSGPKPKGDWHTLISQWLIVVAADDPKRLRNVDALVVEAAAFLEEKISWAPAEPKDLRRKIVELLQLVPR